MRTLRALPTMLRVGMTSSLAYRAEMVVWMLTMTMPLVSLALWSAVASDGPVGNGPQRFAPADFAAYFLATLIVRQLTSSWVVWQINMEIKSGTLSQRLLKPVHPLVAYAAENLGALPLRAAMVVVLVPFALILGGTQRLPNDPAIWVIWGTSLLGAWAIHFLTMVVIGTLAFRLESSSSITDLWMATFMILSGYLVPLDLLPGWFVTLTRWLPFRYTVSFPVETVIGRLGAQDALRDLGIQWAFVLGLATLAEWSWRRGVRRFAAFGG